MVGALAALVMAVGAVQAGAQTSTQTLSPSTLAFGTVTAGDRSAAQSATFSSTSTVTIDTVSVAGPFEIDPGSTCGPRVTVGPGSAGCTVRVVFTPTSTGAQRGTVTVVFGGDVSRQSTLTGTATAPTTTTLPPDSTLPPTTTAQRTTTTSTDTTRPAISTTRPTSTQPTTVGGEPTTTAVPDTVPMTTTTTALTTQTTPPPMTPPPGGGPVGITLDATTAGGDRSGPPGIGLTVAGSGYPAGGGRASGVRNLAAPPMAQAGPACDTVYVFLDGQRIGSARPDASGVIRKQGLAVPGDSGTGRHAVASSCNASGRPVLATAAFDVTDASLHRSALATSLPQADQVDFGADQLLLSALAVVALLVLIAFPAELFNTTLEEHYDEVRGWFGLKPRPIGGGRHHGMLLVVFLMLSGPLWFVMQPASGFDGATAVGALGLSLATAVVVFASDMPAAVHVRRRYRERAKPIALPGALVIAVACVALSRAIHFQPGYFYGLVGGLALSRSLERDESGRLAARTAAALLVLSIGSWLALLPVSAAAAETGKTFGIILTENLLGGIFWTALDSLVIAMLPLRLLEGSKIVGWSRTAWAVLYGVTLLAFVHILLRPSTGYVSNTSVSPPNVVIGLFVGFAVFSFAFWGYFRFRTSVGSPGEALPDEVERAARPVPRDVLVAEGVGAGEFAGGTVGTMEHARHRLVGGELVEPQDRDPV